MERLKDALIEIDSYCIDCCKCGDFEEENEKCHIQQAYEIICKVLEG